MARKILSARVSEEIAERVDEFAERSDSTRTEALDRILREGLQHVDVEGEGESEIPNRAYTVELTPEEADTLDGVAMNAGYGRDEYVRKVLRQQVGPLPDPDW